MNSFSSVAAGLVDRGPGGKPSSVYVHIPFCRDRCTYCAFATVLDDSAVHGPLIDAIIAEASTFVDDAGASPLGPPLVTLYLGGGTPALLEARHLDRLLCSLESVCSFAPELELTLEANPSNVTREALAEWAALGINRLSVGIQTFRDDVLASLGRQHDAAASRRALALIERHWSGDWSADLLVGWRGEQVQDVERDLAALLEFSPPHVSVYGLTIEPGTPLATLAARGHEVSISAGDAARFDDVWAQALDAHGYERYEISNFARPGHRSRHNQVYWSNRSYIGLGPGAASSVHPHRWTNRRDPAAYIAAATSGRSVRAAAERLDPFSRLLESLAIGLRVREGIALAEFDARFSPAWRQLLAANDWELLRRGLLVLGAGRLALHPDCRIKVDTVTSELVSQLASATAARITPDELRSGAAAS